MRRGARRWSPTSPEVQGLAIRNRALGDAPPPLPGEQGLAIREGSPGVAPPPLPEEQGLTIRNGAPGEGAHLLVVVVDSRGKEDPRRVNVVVVDVDVIVDCLHTVSPAMRARHRPTNVAAWEDDAPPSRHERRDGDDGRMTHDADGGGANVRR